MKQFSERLTANGFDGAGFLEIVKNPSQGIISDFSVLSGKPAGASLEGYLFPDTYKFSKEATPEVIVRKILTEGTEAKLSGLKKTVENQNKSFFEILTMASIVEMEVTTPEDRTLVSGIYWNRIKVGQPLQSDITIAYILGEKKKQYSFADTRTVSPYNTYLNTGLPPGPIDNPGLDAIQAAIYPKNSDYNYYLSDPETGQTIFSKSLDEHNANKAKYGL
jgi:UPF0755 protein